MSKPREFWIDTIDDSASRKKITEEQSGWPIIHVIEKSHYDALKQYAMKLHLELGNLLEPSMDEQHYDEKVEDARQALAEFDKKWGRE